MQLPVYLQKLQSRSHHSYLEADHSFQGTSRYGTIIHKGNAHAETNLQYTITLRRQPESPSCTPVKDCYLWRQKCQAHLNCGIEYLLKCEHVTHSLALRVFKRLICSELPMVECIIYMYVQCMFVSVCYFLQFYTDNARYTPGNSVQQIFQCFRETDQSSQMPVDGQ